MDKTLLSIYLTTHLNLIIGLAVFFLLTRVIGRFTFRSRFQFVLRSGQMLFLLALTMPVALSQLSSSGTEKLSPLSYVALPELPDFEVALPKVSRATLKAVQGKETPAHLEEYLTFNYLSSRLMGILAFLITFSLLRQALSYRKLLRLLARSHEIRRLGRVVLSVSDEITIPFSTCIDGKARVVLPLHVLSNRNDLRSVLRHEFQHHRQADVIWTLAIECAESLFFPNPFLSTWKSQLQEYQELACDEAVIERRKRTAKEYGQCLLRFAELAVTSRSLPKGVACMAQQKLERRILMLALHGQNGRRSPLAVGFTSLGAVVLITVSCATRQVASKPAEKEISSSVLAIDKKIEGIARQAVQNAIQAHGAVLGYAVVADARSGKILAAVESVSGKDEIIPPDRVLNRRILPASSMKTLTAALAIDRNDVDPSGRLNCENGSYTVKGITYHDWRKFQELTVLDTVVHSSNICAIKMAEKIGPQHLYEGLKSFGLGASGAMPVPKDSDDFKFAAEVGTGFGGLVVTSHEMVRAYSVFANDGMLISPTGAAPKRVISATTASAIRGALIGVVEVGTGRPVSSKRFSLAGKTSTGYLPDDKSGKPVMAGFIGLAPARDTRYVIQVGVQLPHGKSAHGSSHAGPVFKEIAEAILSPS